jgi:hypothetical protein
MNSNHQNEEHHDVPLEEKKRTRRKDLPEALRKQIIAFIIDRSTMVDGLRKADHGAYAAVAKFFDSSDGKPVNRSTVRKHWLTAPAARATPDKAAYSSSLQRKGWCGCHPLYNPIEVQRAIIKVDLKMRQTVKV